MIGFVILGNVTTMKKPILQRHTSVFRYGQKEIFFRFWSHASSKNIPTDTVIFLGSGQSGRIAKWAAGNAPAGTIVVEGLPHKEADRSACDLKEFTHDYTSTAFLAVLKMFGISSANIIAESQAAPGVVWAALDHLDQVGNIVLIAPLGLTAHILGDSPKARLRELKKRAFLSAMQFAQSPFYDSRNLYIGLLMIHAVLFDARWNTSGQKYAVGASHDLREDCRKLATQLANKGHELTFIVGERDKMFPAREVSASIEEAGVKHAITVSLKISHTSLAVRYGKQILNLAIQTVRQKDSHPN